MIACLLLAVGLVLVGWLLLGLVVGVGIGLAIRIADEGGPLGSERSDTPEDSPP